jgi:integrase/recombinase XerC
MTSERRQVMPARLENEMELNSKIEAILQELPYYVDEWHKKLYASKKTANSRREFVSKVRNFLEFIDKDTADISLDKINDENVTNYYISVGTKINRDGTISETSDSHQQVVYCVLKNFLGFLCKKGYIEENYILNIAKPGNKDLDRINEHHFHFTKNDFEKVIDVISEERNPVCRCRDLAMMKVFMGTGMRRTALKILNVSDIDFQNKTLVTVDKGAGKGKVQKYNLNDSTIQALNDWLDCRDEFAQEEKNYALFVSYQGNRLSDNGISKMVNKYFDQALWMHVSPHKIRAGVASILYEETHDIEFDRRAIGHSNVSTTQRYISTYNDERLQAAKIMEF